MQAYLKLLVLLFSLNCSLVFNKPSPPTFPKTYYSSFAMSIYNNTYLSSGEADQGYIAEYYEENLAIISYDKYSSKESTLRDKYTILFNGKLFRFDDSICTCYDRSYSDAGFPFLSSFHNFKLHYDNTTEIWWEAENDKFPFTLNNHTTFKVLIRVLAKYPNIPVSFSELSPKQVDFHISFSQFHAEAPPKKLFGIPESCTKEITDKVDKGLLFE